MQASSEWYRRKLVSCSLDVYLALEYCGAGDFLTDRPDVGD
jgi:hypothetical protein